MIADGPNVCPWCQTVITFAGGQMVDVQWSEIPCLGCERWHAILKRAREAQAALDAKVEEKPPQVDLNDFSAILARLRGDKPAVPEYDFARAAANDRE